MNETLKIALVQSSLIWENPKFNRVEFTKKIKIISNEVDVIILPEMFTTGFTMSPENINENEGLKTLEWMKEMALEKKAAIVGSIVFKEKDNNYNRLFFVEPNGSFTSYDKRHTFTLAGENLKYVAGNDRVLINFRGFLFCPMVCYDLRFPVWSRNTDGYDVLIYVANWPAPRIQAWDTLLKARAIENMSYAIGVNRIGIDEKGLQYSGHSSAYDSLGNQLAFSDKEEILNVVISKEHLTKTRNKLRFLEDRDDFDIKINPIY
jgi:predicted amidohydrolase